MWYCLNVHKAFSLVPNRIWLFDQVFLAVQYRESHFCFFPPSFTVFEKHSKRLIYNVGFWANCKSAFTFKVEISGFSHQQWNTLVIFGVKFQMRYFWYFFQTLCSGLLQKKKRPFCLAGTTKKGDAAATSLPKICNSR